MYMYACKNVYIYTSMSIHTDIQKYVHACMRAYIQT